MLRPRHAMAAAAAAVGASLVMGTASASPLPMLTPETSWLLAPLLSSFLMVFVVLFFQCGTSNAMAVFVMFLMCYFMLPMLYVLMRTN